ncbi:MAG: ISLre2 family transposase, partial [Minisyncoccia bacterium]
PSGAKVTPRLKELFLKLGSEVSFGRATEILGYLTPGVSAMKVWGALQEVGEALQQEGEEKRAAVFEKGEIPKGEEVASELCIEADGVMIRLQRAEEKRGEIKHIVAYEGKEEVSRGRFSLKNKLVISSLRDGEGAWEESYALIGGKWDLSQTKKFYLGGDGAEWPKQGVEYFPGAEYRLDPYHLSKHLTEALWHDEESFSKVGLAICQGNWEETRRVLEEAAKKSRGNRRKRVTKLIQYLQENWAGVINSPGVQRLGSIEGQIQHNIARRMKRLGARWTTSGGDRMARVLAAKANGELEHYIGRWPVEHQRLKEMAQKKVVEKPQAEDIEKWLRVSLPALKGPFADRPWIKYVLREVTRPSFWALVG